MVKVSSAIVSVFFATLAVGNLTSCKNGNSDKAANTADTSLSDAKRIDSLTSQKKKEIDFKFATLEANIPSPFDVVNDLHGYNAPFKKELLNPESNVEKYASTFKKEVNFGIYGIDLAYINFYGQNQDMMKYFTTIQKIAEDLNIDKVFDGFAERFKANSENHDSVVTIVDNVFNATDDYLNKNDRYLVASHVIAGSVIEVNYLSLNLIKDFKRGADNEKLFVKVFNENLAIYHMINLFEKFTDKDSKELLASMKTYRTAYDGIIKSAADLTPENINKAIVLIDEMRNKVTK